MQLVTFTSVNRNYFKKGSRPSKKEWAAAIESGEINGKIVLGKVFVDIDEFLAKDIFSANDPEEREIDLLEE